MAEGSRVEKFRWSSSAFEHAWRCSSCTTRDRRVGSNHGLQLRTTAANRSPGGGETLSLIKNILTVLFFFLFVKFQVHTLERLYFDYPNRASNEKMKVFLVNFVNFIIYNLNFINLIKFTGICFCFGSISDSHQCFY